MSVGSRSWKVVKPHIPLIKFSKRGKEAAQGLNHKLNSGSTSVTPQTCTILDDVDLPPKYSRKPLTQYEIETIERGGPE